MKKALFCFLILLAMLASGCAKNAASESSSSEPSDQTESTQSTVDKRPTIDIQSTDVTIRKGDTYDLLDGVTGSDDVDGDITDRIVIDDGGFDPDTTGKYTVTYSLTDSAGNTAVSKRRTITVKEAVMQSPPLWTDAIDGEKLNPQAPAALGGAWYHKVVSSKDKWVGIETVVTLPAFDIERYSGDYDSSLPADPSAKNLHNPSVYLGGCAWSESDVGLSLSLALTDASSQTISKGSIAYRPFWRYITSENQDAGGYDVHGGEYAVSANGKNCIANYHWRYTEYYYLPGDKLRMIVYSPAPDKLQLMIEVLEASTLPASVEMRKTYGWKEPADFISPIFQSPGHGTGMDAEFKRVNAIDQSGNEGGQTIPTETEVGNIIWHETYLYREIDGVLRRVPMNENRRGVTSAPDEAYFTVSYEGVDSSLGGEVVSIHPGYRNG